jgi:hypothetical protein
MYIRRIGPISNTISQSAPVSDSQLQFQIESAARGMAFVFKWLHKAFTHPDNNFFHSSASKRLSYIAIAESLLLLDCSKQLALGRGHTSACAWRLPHTKLMLECKPSTSRSHSKKQRLLACCCWQTKIKNLSNNLKSIILKSTNIHYSCDFITKFRTYTGGRGPADADWRTRTGGLAGKFFYQFFDYWK